jgi:hypothetical protein
MTIRKVNGTKYQPAKNVSFWFALPNAFSNFASPTVAELNATLNINDAVTADNFDFGAQASNQIDSRSFNQAASAQSRGFAQFGGTIGFYYPRNPADTSNKYQQVYTAMKTPGTAGYLIVRVDGTRPATNGEAAADGDIVSVYKVLTDGWSKTIDGENPFTYQITFLPQGDVAVKTVVRTAAATVTVTPATASVATGATTQLSSTVQGRNLTFGGVRWSTSDATKATVSAAGVVTGVAAGTATITATFMATGATATSTITVT